MWHSTHQAKNEDSIYLILETIFSVCPDWLYLRTPGLRIWLRSPLQSMRSSGFPLLYAARTFRVFEWRRARFLIITTPVLSWKRSSGEPDLFAPFPERGAYKGIPVSVAPIMAEGKAIAALGVVDVFGTIDIPEVFGAYTDVLKQVNRGSPGKE